MRPDPHKTGLFLVGARGAIATTVLHGLEGLRTGLPPVGLVTGGPQFAHLPWADLNAFHVFGWDITGDSHQAADEMARIGVLPRDLVELCADLRDRLELSMAAGYPDPEDAELANRGARDRLLLKPAEAVEALREDMHTWKSRNGLRRSVVVYLATAERQRQIPAAWEDPDADPLELIQSAPMELPRSLIYATAAIAEGNPFVNFTPAPGAAVAALSGWASRRNVPVLGNDGKTGETLVKTALAPLFRDRALRVLAWEGYNLLGNRDGAALTEEARRGSKIQNKDQALRTILGSESTHTRVGIDFVPSLHDWKTAWDFIHFEGFLGARMSLQFTWQGSDSVLAAPLVLDLARLALLAQEREEGGPLRAAASFFKCPLGVHEHDFHRQMDLLRDWLGE